MDIGVYMKLGQECGLQGKELLDFVQLKEKEFKEEKRHQQELEREDRIRERLEREKEREHERLVAKLKAERKVDKDPVVNVPCMPPFRADSDELDAYLLRFERHATLCKWPQDCWASALGNLLTGRALAVYAQMSAEDVLDYAILKKTLLQHFALTSDGFRKRFREAKRASNESFKQFATRLSSYVKRWVELSERDISYDTLTELIVMEQIVEGCDRSFSVFIKERDPKSLAELVNIAEQYSAAHGPVAHGSNRSSQSEAKARRPPNGSQRQDKTTAPNHGKQSGRSQSGGPRCYVCGSQGHLAPSCPDRKGGYGGKNPSSSKRSDGRNQTGGACVIGVCPEIAESEVVSQDNSLEVDARTVTLECGHKLPVLSAGCTMGTHMPVCEGTLNGKTVKVLRDTGCSSIVVRAGLVDESQYTGDKQVCVLIDGTARSVPIATVEVSSPYFSGKVNALCMTNPIYDLIIGNIAGAKKPEDVTAHGSTPDGVEINDSVTKVSCSEAVVDEGSTETSLEPDLETQVGGVETRGMKQRKEKPWKPLGTSDGPEITATREDIVAAQQKDDTLGKLRSFADKGEPKVVGKGHEVQFFYNNGLLFRKYTLSPQAGGRTYTQLVVPTIYRSQVMKLAHDSALAGHLKAKKTTERILAHFFWPGMEADVRRYCASCDPCQRTIPKGRIGKVPVILPPLIDTCFRRIAIDLVGPLQPVTDRGNRYILTIVDLATRYPEAIALPRIETEYVAEALMEVFSRLGVPNEILSDNGSQFVSGMMKEVARLLGIKQFHTTPYHPMANGVCERFNGTLKQMLRRMCQERPRDWDRYLPALLFAYREVPHESLGYSPFELMYGREVRGPLTVLKELWTKEIPEEDVKTTYQYVIDLQDRLETTCQMAKTELEKSSVKYKKYFDVKARDRTFNCGDRVLLLLPTSSNKLLLQWRGPYTVVKKVSRHNYSLQVGQKEKTYHANLMKRYVERLDDQGIDFVEGHDDQTDELPTVPSSAMHVVEEGEEDECVVDISFPSMVQTESAKDVKFGEGVDEDKRMEMAALIHEFEDVLTDVPGKTDIISHTIELNTQTHIRSRPYQVPQAVRDTIREEVDTMLKMGVIEKSTSPYASPVVIVKKKDGKNRFCIDYRRLNAVTVLDNEPIPNMDELISEIKDAKYFTKMDLSKGYWQIPVDEQDRSKTAFVTPDGQYEFKVLPFGLVNAPAVFTRMMRKLLDGLPRVIHYIDDVLIFSSSWEEHVDDVRRVLEAFRDANLTARPSKCHMGCSTLEFLGHIVGNGELKPTPEGVSKVLAASRPTTKKEVRAFMGMVGYYRKFIPNMAVIATPLTDLTKKDAPSKVRWGDAQESAFQTLKERVSRFPILRLPDGEKEFVLRTDASDVGIGAVLLQCHEDELFPVQYASRKLHTRERAYPIIERECLAIVWAVKKFAYFLHGRQFRIQTDHFPLANLSQTQMKNPRVMRWALALQAHQYHVDVIKGSNNVGADYLSRCPRK